MSTEPMIRQRSFGLVTIIFTLLFNVPVAASSFYAGTQAKVVFEGTATFYETGQTVSGVLGGGTFDYEPTPFEGEYVARNTDVPSLPEARLSITADQNLHRITNFSMSVMGVDWSGWGGFGGGQFANIVDYFFQLNPGAGDTAPDPAIGLVSVVERGPEPGLELGGWDFGFSRGTTGGMSAGGTWGMVGVDEDPQFEASGTWHAQPVPEPLTVLGSAAALLFGVVFRFLVRKA